MHTNSVECERVRGEREGETHARVGEREEHEQSDAEAEDEDGQVLVLLTQERHGARLDLSSQVVQTRVVDLRAHLWNGTLCEQ
jgi:hypothetical protein